MGIHGINGYQGFNSYKIPEMPNVKAEDIRKQNHLTKEALPVEFNENIHEAPAVIRPRKDAPLEDISLTFNKQDGFGAIGQDSDIHSLDMEKAISDMKKDQVLQQYNYFVGNTSNLILDNADGMVFSKF